MKRQIISQIDMCDPWLNALNHQKAQTAVVWTLSDTYGQANFITGKQFYPVYANQWKA